MNGSFFSFKPIFLFIFICVLLSSAFPQASSLQRIGGGGGVYVPRAEFKLQPPPYSPSPRIDAQAPNDPFLKNKLIDLDRTIQELDFWENQAPRQIGQLKAKLEDYKRQDRAERWKLRAKDDPPPQFPQIADLETKIPLYEQEAIEKTKKLIQLKAQIEMAIQLHDKDRWETLRKRFNAGECTPEEIERVVSEKDQFYIKQIFGPPDFAGSTKIYGKKGSYDVLEFRYDLRIKNKYTEKTEDLYLYFYGNAENKKCIGRKLGSDGTISIFEIE
ncbi:MAG: hypothetical protein RL549_848 [Verrucomicrobiota bacterium]|jgi:hypothetical protein